LSRLIEGAGIGSAISAEQWRWGRMKETETLAEDWAKVMLLPQRTGLPMTVWITPRDGLRRDVPVKVSRTRGGRGLWPEAISVAVRPAPRVIPPGQLSAADLRFVSDWIALNRDVIVDYWDDKIDVYEALPRLQKLPSGPSPP
jgi:hypothetical protein